MAGLRDLEEGIARLEAATVAADEATARAHAARKDLEQVLREAGPVLAKSAQELIDAQLEPLVKRELEQLTASLAEFSPMVRTRILDQVDRIINMCLGTPNGKTPTVNNLLHRKADLRPVLAAHLREFIERNLVDIVPTGRTNL